VSAGNSPPILYDFFDGHAARTARRSLRRHRARAASGGKGPGKQAAVRAHAVIAKREDAGALFSASHPRRRAGDLGAAYRCEPTRALSANRRLSLHRCTSKCGKLRFDSHSSNDSFVRPNSVRSAHIAFGEPCSGLDRARAPHPMRRPARSVFHGHYRPNRVCAPWSSSHAQLDKE
jgi:hypothetical protein